MAFTTNRFTELVTFLFMLLALTYTFGGGGIIANFRSFRSAKKLEHRKAISCAYVSSSGVLLGSKLGKQIDSHDLVIRVNAAPTIGFEEDVGNLTNGLVLNTICYCVPHKRINCPKIQDNYLHIAAISLVVTRQNCEPINLIQSQQNSGVVFRNVWNFATDNVFERGRRQATVGLYGLFSLSHVCDSVTIFGFNVNHRNPFYHYYDNRSTEQEIYGAKFKSNMHDFLHEKIVLANLTESSNLSDVETIKMVSLQRKSKNISKAILIRQPGYKTPPEFQAISANLAQVFAQATFT